MQNNPTLDAILDLARRVTLAMIREEGQALGYSNPLNLRDCPWFAVAFPTELWPDKIPKRIYPGGQVVQRTERFRSGVSVGWFWDPAPGGVIPIIGGEKSITVPDALGMAGALHDVVLHIAEGQSLARFIEGFAPATENATSQYVANVAQWAGILDAYAPMLSTIKPAVVT